MNKTIKNFFLFILITFFCWFHLNPTYALNVKKNVITHKVLSDKDVRLYSEIFNLQKKMIKNRSSNIWIKIENKSKISNKLGHLRRYYINWMRNKLP